MAGMLGLGAGGALSSGGRQLFRFVTMGFMVGGLGLAGAGAYTQNLPPQTQGAQAYVQSHATLFIAIGVAAVVAGAVVSFWARQRMMTQMTASMGMGGGGMPYMSRMMSGMGAGAREVVKVRCPSCKTLQDEVAAF